LTVSDRGGARFGEGCGSSFSADAELEGLAESADAADADDEAEFDEFAGAFAADALEGEADEEDDGDEDCAADGFDALCAHAPTEHPSSITNNNLNMALFYRSVDR
jgi:hypothetical protein